MLRYLDHLLEQKCSVVIHQVNPKTGRKILIGEEINQLDGIRKINPIGSGYFISSQPSLNNKKNTSSEYFLKVEAIRYEQTRPIQPILIGTLTERSQRTAQTTNYKNVEVLVNEPVPAKKRKWVPINTLS